MLKNKSKPISEAAKKLLDDRTFCEALVRHLGRIATGKEKGDAVKAFIALRDTVEGPPKEASLAEKYLEFKAIELIERKENVPLPIAESKVRNVQVVASKSKPLDSAPPAVQLPQS